MSALTTHDTGPTAQAIIDRNAAVLNEVHDYALAELGRLETKIASVKHAIEIQKNMSAQATEIYLRLVEQAVRSCEDIERTVAGLERMTRARPVAVPK